ncbi:MAG: HAMP domain-containing sensor histidine kinase [Sediminicola sp.]
MKLLNRTTTYFAIPMLLVLGIWTVLFYHNMLDEIYDSMDDGLENQKLLVIQKAKNTPEILNTPLFEDGYYTIKPIAAIPSGQVVDTYRDTLMYMQNERDFEPVRLLETVFQINGSHYKLKLITSMVEEDDLVEDLLYSILWLYLGLLAVLLILNNIVLKKIWDPFYTLLSRLADFRLEKDRGIDPIRSNIDEFVQLNTEVQKLVQLSVSSYTGQKQFIENASHELQTPLAISINKLELLAESGVGERAMESISSVLDNLERLVRLNRSLLLLSKIGNRNYLEETSIDFGELTKRLMVDFKDMAVHKKIEVHLKEEAKLQHSMNGDLANVLLTNLLINALVHGRERTTLMITISNKKMELANFGTEGALAADGLFERFQKTGRGAHSTGLGLAIAKAVADRYGIGLQYHFTDRHLFTLHFP